ncbi:MAG: haloalkane dehalogenase [Pseudomonadota bacterium]
MDIFRTPDSRFETLPDWPYAPHYLDSLPGYAGLRVHYVDEGPRDAPVVLCLHGEPTWAYLYRRMIPVFLGAGYRVVAPDWLGFGRSDKPTDDAVYGFDWHRNMMLELIDWLALRQITLVVQDWGGLLGLTLPHARPVLFKRLLVMNTTLPVGEKAGPGFDAWRAYVAANPDLAVGRLMARSCPHLTPEEAAAYDAPFPDEKAKAGVRRFPAMVMTDPDMEGIDHSRAAIAYLSQEWSGESFMAVGKADPVLGVPVMAALRQVIRGCPAPLELPDTGHFVQEWGEGVAQAALSHWASVPSSNGATAPAGKGNA